jgi:tRNA A37 threonylcarbamoyladenosine synthetase subunit TsaC/SUA5/YrdC
MSDDIDIVLDGGFAPCGEASTVIRVDNARISVIRAGSIAPERIERAWSRIVAAGTPPDV